MLLLTLTLLILSSSTEAYNEKPCRDAGGYCLSTSAHCPNDNFQSGLCPTQTGDIKCCLSAPYQEEACRTSGGTCKEDITCSGNQLTGKCTNQPNDVICCLASSEVPSCGDLGGDCINYSTCNNLVVGGICPGSEGIKCCVPNTDIDEVFKHVNKMEGGMYLQGYIPTSGSGVTISTGVDLGQWSENELKNVVGVDAPEAFWAKIRPYLGLKTEDAVHDAGLDEKDLVIEISEGISLDGAFNEYNLKRVERYVQKMTVKGKAVVASLNHWCGNIVDTTPEGKCYHKNCPNFLRDVLISETATDSDFLYSLRLQKECLLGLGEADWKIGRIQKEIDYLFN